MSMIAKWFKTNLIAAVIAAVALLGVLPPFSVHAQTADPPAAPSAAQPTNARLQTAWSREQTVYARIGTILDRAQTLISRIQTRLDEAQAKGRDVSSVQRALDAFSGAVKNVQPIYTALQALMQSHAGFDASGNVTDPAQALQMVQAVRAQFQAIRQAGLRESAKALREAIRAFRQANQPATPAPSSLNG
ncbi:MAG TPA: hypothetical protein VLZ89_07270 [Anaerolineales bacterium]|nr:hypothetical protein [Anaerolineales bacterium]